MPVNQFYPQLYIQQTDTLVSHRAKLKKCILIAIIFACYQLGQNFV